MSLFSASDHMAMARALRLAERGLWTTSPNPRVGCVLVRDGETVGEGWHRRAGEPHAEPLALVAAGDRARGATAYVTLEPCAHHGRTPPCAEALIAAGVRRVVAAMRDPDPRVAGQGLQRLRAAGISTEVGLMETAARALNAGFVSRLERGRPWVRVKIAASLDGRTALSGGESQWITGAEARRDGHRWRARACAVLTGIGTVQLDDPRLTVREFDCERQPLRIVVDSRLRLSPQARIVDGAPLLVATASDDAALAAPLRAAGADVWRAADDAGHVDLAALLTELARRGIGELHVEAGARLNGALLRLGLVDELLLYFAAAAVGSASRGMFAFPELASLADRIPLTWIDQRAVGADWRLLARVG